MIGKDSNSVQRRYAIGVDQASRSTIVYDGCVLLGASAGRRSAVRRVVFVCFYRRAGLLHPASGCVHQPQD